MSNARRKHHPRPESNHADNAATPRLVVLPKSAETPAPKTDAKAQPARIGDILRQARLERNEDLYLIADYLCIKPAFLIALENSRYDEFPADAYVVGFLRSYASFLGINGKDAIDRYRYEMAGRRVKPVLYMPSPMSEGRAPSAVVMIGACIAALLIYALWYSISSSSRAQIHAPPPLPVAQQQSTAPAQPAVVAPPSSASVAVTTSGSANEAVGIVLSTPAPAATALTAPPAATAKTPDVAAKPAKIDAATPDAAKTVFGDAHQASRLVIRATQSSWVMVSDASGKAVFDQVLKPGEIFKVPDQQGLTLTTGNGGGIVLVLDNHDLPKVANGAPHVVRDIPLDPAKLSASQE